MPDQLSLFKPSLDKLYYRVGEVSRIVDLPAYVLRFWEGEFKVINPKRTASGQRLYRPKDIALILQIKDLLYEKKFTIEGARKQLQQGGKIETAEPAPEGQAPQRTGSPSLADIRRELLQIRAMLG
jgi:DNA-binding transcriptional MerR regulator